MDRDFFFYGTLCHLPLLERVLARKVKPEPAQMAGWRAVWADGQPHAVLVEDAGGVTDGILLRGLTHQEEDRLDFYEGGFDFLTRRIPVQTAQGAAVQALVYFSAGVTPATGQPWALGDWAAQFGPAFTATAGDVMALYGKVAAEDVAARTPQMLVRGDSRARAEAQASPAKFRRTAGAGDVAVESFDLGYAKFFSVEDYRLSFRRFDGSMSPPVGRAAFVSGDAVTVLPYDPVRDCVLLVEQFRTGPFARGDRNPWQLEAIAGRIDPGESPENCARREAEEEAGLTLGALLPVGNFYPSPGAKSEFVYAYLALADLPDGAAGVFGVADEAEDIRGHIIGFDDFLKLVASGEVANAPLLVTALWLQRERAAIRKAAGA